MVILTLKLQCGFLHQRAASCLCARLLLQLLSFSFINLKCYTLAILVCVKHCLKKVCLFCRNRKDHISSCLFTKLWSKLNLFKQYLLVLFYIQRSIYRIFHSVNYHFHLNTFETVNVIIPRKQNDSELIKKKI